MIATVFGFVMLLSVSDAHQKEITQFCQDLGYSTATYVEDSGNKYMCQ